MKAFHIDICVPAPDQRVAIAGVSVDHTAGTTSGFLCLANGADQRFQIPPSILQSLRSVPRRKNGNGGFLFLATLPVCEESLFPSPGLEVLWGRGLSIDGRTLRFHSARADGPNQRRGDTLD